MLIHYPSDQVGERYAEALRLCSQECELRLGEGYYCLMHFHGYNIPLTLGLRQAAASPCRRHTRRATLPHMPRAGPQLAPDPPVPLTRTHCTRSARSGFLGAISRRRARSLPISRSGLHPPHRRAIIPPARLPQGLKPWPHPAQTASCRRPLVSDSQSPPEKT